jgi:endo-1,4-beta-xylanase
MRMRHGALGALLATTLSSGLLAGGVLPATSAPAQRVPDPATATLRELAKPTKLRVGTAVDMSALASDATYRGMVAEQFDSVTPENVMKWEVVQPRRGRFDFSQADELVDFAREHRQKVRGHTLVWHSQLPTWLTAGTWTREQLRSILRRHIFTVAGHFRGRIWAWDVVNEAFNDDGTLRDTLWLRVLGPDYIADAFRWAHQADPKATLFYNDYNIEGVNAKSDAVYALVHRLQAQGVPVQGVGLQAHLGTQYGFPGDVLQNLRRFARLGLDTAMTEADVRSVVSDGFSNPEVQAQAQGYSMLMQSCLLVRSCVSYTVWGFTDKYQWVPGVFAGEGNAAIFDANFRPRPAYDALRRDLALAPRLGSRG